MRLHVNGKDIEKQKIYIGFEGEKNYTEIEFDFSDVFSEYPEASAYMNIKPYKGEIYPHTLTREGTNLLVWNVNEADCAVPGVGMYQITFTYNNTVIKSFKGICVVRDSIIGSADPPTPVEEWIADASAALAALENITASAENLPEGSDATAEIRTVNGHKDIHIGVPKGDQGDQGDPGFSPTVTVTDIPNGHQVTVTDESGEHTFTVMNGEDGDDGVSPQIAVTNITGGHRVSVTDASGTNTFDVMDGQDGQDGVTPDFSIGSVQTLPAGSDATASVTGTAANPVLNLGIPQGAKGDPGEIPQETLDQIEQDISDLNSALKEKADIIVSSASGAIASFPDGAESTAKELVVGIEPVQDLHGQDSPYPPGGGKNILPYPFPETTKTTNGITYTDNGDGSVTVNGTATSSAFFNMIAGAALPLKAGTYTFSGTNGQAVLVVADGSSHYTQESGYTVTYDTDVTVNVFLRVASGQTVSNVTVKPQINIGSAIIPWSPYSNICPISGWSGANVQRTGKNLLPNDKYQQTSTTVVLGQKNANYEIKLKAGTYYVSLTSTKSVSLFYRTSTGSSNVLIANYPYGSFTLSEDSDIRIWAYRGNDGVSVDDISDFQLELGSTATAYEAPHVTSLSISFPSQAGTVYGGSLTVNEDGSGKLVVDRAKYLFNHFTFTKSGNFFRTVISDIITNQSYSAVKCSAYVTRSGVGQPNVDMMISQNSSSEKSIRAVLIADSRFSDATAFATETSSYELVYELATPIEYTLTDVEVLELLKGVNNVWADTGNTSVTYRADTKLYIDNKITQAIANALNS